MTIALGRRRLVLSLVSNPRCAKAFDLPMAVNATDGELARLNGTNSVAEERRRWEANALLHSAMKLR